MIDQNEISIRFFREFFSTPKLLDIESASDLLNFATKFSRIEEDYYQTYSNNLTRKKVAILGSFTIDHFVKVLNLYLYHKNISAEYYLGSFDNTNYELLDRNSGLHHFLPEITLLLTRNSDIQSFPNMFSTSDDVERWVDEQIDQYQVLWDTAKTLKCQLLQTNFVKPIARSLGNLEANYLFSRSHCFDLLNIGLAERAPSSVTIIDAEHLAGLVGRLKWFSEKDYYLSKQGMSFDVMGLLSQSLSNTIASFSGFMHKCLVLDLDNTLWGGILGDDGLDGIILDSNDPLGEAFLAFQDFVKQLKERGVMLAVCSKNDPEIAQKVFEQHPNMILQIEDISCFKANWEDKPKNLCNIADILNIGLDTIVFFDDNPAEREIVSKSLPQVTVVNVPEDPADFVRALELEMSFDWATLSVEDIGRSKTFTDNQKRRSLEQLSYNYDDYLEGLQMKAKFGEAGPTELPRLVQLINKTNQFNLCSNRYTYAEVEEMSKDTTNFKVIYVALKDKFSDYGVITALIIRKLDSRAFIDTWVMSCRVFKRGLESLIINCVVEMMRSWGISIIIGQYFPTSKNNLVSTLYPDFGFKLDDPNKDTTDNDYNKYSLTIDEAKEFRHLIKIEH